MYSTTQPQNYTQSASTIHVTQQNPYSIALIFITITRWFKYDRDYLCVNKSQFVPVVFEPPCILHFIYYNLLDRYYFLRRTTQLLSLHPVHQHQVLMKPQT
jgi:hypothetical protein